MGKPNSPGSLSLSRSFFSPSLLPPTPCERRRCRDSAAQAVGSIAGPLVGGRVRLELIHSWAKEGSHAGFFSMAGIRCCCEL
ncbi:hypothetical protein SETIT_8G070200v2 [Setaria italica]|uniref:Uncharacterized protein n=1 Tax=Setaria italica TaxID=4555 RepID=K3ZKN4_SETIT|nr:hypothetical protein SETIT_8G070200v2 [Setaria italica]